MGLIFFQMFLVCSFCGERCFRANITNTMIKNQKAKCFLSNNLFNTDCPQRSLHMFSYCEIEQYDHPETKKKGYTYGRKIYKE